MADQRKKNVNWIVTDRAGGTSLEQAQLAVLMDIRDELQALNRRLACANVLNIPLWLSEIATNTRRRKPAKTR